MKNNKGSGGGQRQQGGKKKEWEDSGKKGRRKMGRSEINRESGIEEIYDENKE